MFQTELLIWMSSWQTPWLDKVAYLLTFLGNEPFYFLIIPFVYWCVSKRVGFRLLYIFLISIYVNTWLKIYTAFPRPVGVEGVQSMFVESAEVGSHYPNDSFPSGHAQGSTTLWGYLALKVQKLGFWLLAILLIVLISLSRLYTGLHWPLDIVAGVLIAIFILLMASRLEKWVANLPGYMQWLLVVLVPVFLVWISNGPEGIKYAGFLLGAGIGYLLEVKQVKMNVRAPVWKRGSAFVLGMLGLVLLQAGLPYVLPELVLSDFIRYAVIGLWGMYMAPWLFVKLKLYEREHDHRVYWKGPFSI